MNNTSTSYKITPLFIILLLGIFSQISCDEDEMEPIQEDLGCSKFSLFYKDLRIAPDHILLSKDNGTILKDTFLSIYEHEIVLDSICPNEKINLTHIQKRDSYIEVSIYPDVKNGSLVGGLPKSCSVRNGFFPNQYPHVIRNLIIHGIDAVEEINIPMDNPNIETNQDANYLKVSGYSYKGFDHLITLKKSPESGYLSFILKEQEWVENTSGELDAHISINSFTPINEIPINGLTDLDYRGFCSFKKNNMNLNSKRILSITDSKIFAPEDYDSLLINIAYSKNGSTFQYNRYLKTMPETIDLFDPKIISDNFTINSHEVNWQNESSSVDIRHVYQAGPYRVLIRIKDCCRTENVSSFDHSFISDLLVELYPEFSEALKRKRHAVIQFLLYSSSFEYSSIFELDNYIPPCVSFDEYVIRK